MDKYKDKLPKDDLKRFAKEVPRYKYLLVPYPAYTCRQISKKLVNSDYKNNRVKDPTKCPEKQEKQVKKYVKEFFDKAVEKDKERQAKKGTKRAKEGNAYKSPPREGKAEAPKVDAVAKSDDDQQMAMSDDEEEKPIVESTTPATPMDQLSVIDKLKRKREEEINSMTGRREFSTPPSKRLQSEAPPPPPPPPPAPANGDYPEAESMLEDTMTPEAVDTEMDVMSAPSPPPPPSSVPTEEMAKLNGNSTIPHPLDSEDSQDVSPEEEKRVDLLDREDHGQPHAVHA